MLSDIPTLTLQEAKQNLFIWLDDMKYRRSNWNEYVTYEDEKLFKLTLWTTEFKYVLTVSIELQYLACYAQHRKIKPCDSTPKSNDLHSGKIEKDTFDRIMRDIVSYELISVFKKKTEPE